MYGSRTNSAGESVRASGGTAILTGEKVVGNVITYFGMAEDQNGDKVEDRAEIRFLQSNGATFNYTFFKPDENQSWTVDKLNRDTLHICTRLVSEDEYYNVVEGTSDFKDFINKIKEQIITKATGKSFTLKIIVKENTGTGKWYPRFPQYPNFMEADGTTPSTLSTNPKYDLYQKPETTSEQDLEEPVEKEEELF